MLDLAVNLRAPIAASRQINGLEGAATARRTPRRVKSQPAVSPGKMSRRLHRRRFIICATRPSVADC